MNPSQPSQPTPGSYPGNNPNQQPGLPQPQQAYPANPLPPLTTNNPTAQYDFFLSNPNIKHPYDTSASKQRRIMIAVAGGVGLLLAFGIIAVLMIRGSGSKDGDILLKIAQQQGELIRISTVGETKARSINTQAFASNVKFSLTTGQSDIVGYLKSVEKKKVDSKTLALGANAKTDTALNNAAIAGTFDAVFMTTLRQELADYQSAVSTQYKTTTAKKQKEILKKLYDQSVILLQTEQ